MGANLKIFSARSGRYGAILRFRDKIYTPGIDEFMNTTFIHLSI